MYQIHWVNGHKEGWSPILFPKDEAEKIIERRKMTETDSVFDLIAIEGWNG